METCQDPKAQFKLHSGNIFNTKNTEYTQATKNAE